MLFIDDPQGAANLQWFKGLAADEDDRKIVEQSFKFTNHPRERVNWYQAMAFCRWFSQQLGGASDLKKVAEWAVRLPTEYEWEKAVHDADGRIYPYQGDFDPAKANTSETNIGQTSAVGIIPNGASPYDVQDLSGNVWEWCLSDYQKTKLDPNKENLSSNAYRVLRGGAWFVNQGDARAVFRHDSYPIIRLDGFGFRVVGVICPPSL